MEFKVQYVAQELSLAAPFDGLGWPVRLDDDSRATTVEQYRGGARLGVTCTQLPPPCTRADQRRIVDEWCRFFRRSPPVRELALTSRVPVELFEAVCDHAALERLHVKWGPVVELAPLRRLEHLTGLYLGTTSVTDIAPLADLPGLTHLSLNDFKAVGDFGALAGARQLEFLMVEGYPHGPRKIHVKDLTFLAPLRRLRALCIGFVIVDTLDLDPLLGLSELVYLDLPPICETDRARLREALPKLRYGNVAAPGG